MKKLMLVCLMVTPFCQAADPYASWHAAVANISDLENAREIDLSQKGIDAVPEDLTLKTAKTLDLSDNALMSFPEVADFPELQNLYLQDNNLGGISFDRIKAPNLTLLNIQDNMLSWFNVPSTFDQLEVLYLQGNLLSGLPKSFNPPSLERLNLADNNIDDHFINRMIKRFQDSKDTYLPRLRYLDVSGNDEISLDAIKRLQAVANKVYIKFNFDNSKCEAPIKEKLEKLSKDEVPTEETLLKLLEQARKNYPKAP